MKRIIALVLLLCTLFVTSASLFSCELIFYVGNGDHIGSNDDIDSGDNDGENGDDETDHENENIPEDEKNPSEDEKDPPEDEKDPSEDVNPDTGNDNDDCADGKHVDKNNDDKCDVCLKSVIVIIDFYVVNDLHGKFCDTDNQPGVDELGTYLNNMKKNDDHVVVLSSGDMWQGTAESNLSRGLIITEWMNEMDFVSMTLGNHEYDWGEAAIINNLEVAEFPFLAINIFEKATGKRPDYCTPSIMIERGDIQIGIIGAIGDCYSSISSDKVAKVEFKVGDELAALVRAEATSLREAGADLIVYSLHDGYGSSSSGTGTISSSKLSDYYTPSLSNGVVDVVFEAHTHQYYTLTDSYGVYHLQGGGENKGISHLEIAVNSANGNNKVREAGFVATSVYSNLADDPTTEAVEEKYSDIIDRGYSVIGTASKYYDDSVIEDKVAELYLEAGLEKWGDKYNVFLGGGYLNTRSPYNLYSGEVTYAELLSLLPFDNEIVLCSISGYKLKQAFVSTTNSNYHIAYSNYGNANLSQISNNQTYYVIVDTYTAFYSYNGLTIIEYLDYTTYARDLLAEAVKNGEL